MIIDANSVCASQSLETDICVVGSGAAGITLALTLAQQGVRVILLGGGAQVESARAQALYAGEVSDERMHSPPDKYRQRRFGGSTTIWGGRCIPYDPIDFEARAFVADSGWPISYEEIARYYPEACDLVEIGDFQFDADKAFHPPAPPLIDGFHSDRVLTNGLERFSCPTNFAARYGERLRRSDKVQVLLNAHCIGISLSEDASNTEALQVADLDGRRFTISARAYVLASGGLEIPRLLLASNDVSPAGVGNQHDVVGRYYMCHIAGNVGSLIVNKPLAAVRHGYERTPDGVYCRRRFTLTATEQRRLGVGNVAARLHFPNIADPAHGIGVLSGLYLAKNFISYEYGKRLHDGSRATVSRYFRHAANVLRDSIDTAGFLFHWVTKRTLAERKFPSVILSNRSNRFSLDISVEQSPLATSRVTLIEKRDELGMPRLRVDWRYARDDIDTAARTLDVFAEEFQRTGVGTLTVNHERLEGELLRFGAYGGHHIGTARMGLDPRRSVVDPDCRVHGVNNLFIAGSAVFPTSSQANPTLTIVALSLRLARFLRSAMASASFAPALCPKS